MTWESISRDDILRWSTEAVDSDGVLPELIARLIVETGEEIVFLDAPAGTGVSTGGFDLVVEANGESLYVPKGVLVWETSVQTGAHGKAESDYLKRTDGPLGMLRKDVHYRAVSTQKWTKRKEFDKHTTDGIWKSVRGLNVESLVSWLAIAPGTSAWMRSVMGIPIVGQIHWSAWWKRWLESTNVSLDATVLLAGREELVDQIADLSASPGVTSVGGGGLQWEAAVATFAAVAQRALDNDRFSALPARLVIFEQEAAFVAALSSGRPLVALIPNASWVTAIPDNSLAHVFVFTHPAHMSTLEIPATDSEGAAKALETQGVEFHRAYELGYLARRDITTLRRELAIQPALFTPSWAARDLDARERRLALVARWNAEFEGDRRFVAALLGGDAADASETWASILKNEGRPTAEFEAHRYLVSPTDTWRLLSHSITDEDLAVFESEVATVLGTANPLAELDGTERIRAQIQGVGPQHSRDIADGIGMVLALMGADEDVARTATKTSASAARVVRNALGLPAQPLEVSALVGRPFSLSLLAEAAPDAVLDYLDAVAAMPPEQIFTDSRERGAVTFGPSSPHLELVHAADVLSWSTAALPRVVSVLLRLHAIDPGGTWSNRPLDSLRKALSPVTWNTSVPWDRRLAVIAEQLDSDGGASWDAFAGLVDDDGFGVIEPGPRYRQWGPRLTGMTSGELADRRFELVSVLLPRATSPEHAKAAIGWLPQLSSDGRALVLERLAELVAGWSDAETQVPYEELRSLIADHTEFDAADWSLPAEDLLPLRALLDDLTPTDPRHKNEWLFHTGYPRLIDFPRGEDWAAQTAEVQRLRVAAIDEIESGSGFESVLEFAEQLPDVSTLTWALASRGTPLNDTTLVTLLGAGPSRSRFAMSYLARRVRDDADLPVRLLDATPNANAKTRAHLFQFLAIESATEKLGQETEDVQTAFWAGFNPWSVQAGAPTIEAIARTLVERGQAGLAVTTLDVHGEGVANEVIADALESLLAGQAGGTKAEGDSIDRLTIRLQGDASMQDRLILLEWAFLPALNDRRQLELHRSMATSPARFVEVLEARMGQDGEIVSRGWKVLRSWRTIPGEQDSGVIDESILRDWSDEVSTRIADWDDNKKALAWGAVGELLSRAGNDPVDGKWPPTAIRQLVNDLRIEALEQGIGRGIYNDRGVEWRSMDGGVAERELAKKYREQAAALAADDRTAALLRRLADGYESSALQEDQRAEARRRGLGI